MGIREKTKKLEKILKTLEDRYGKNAAASNEKSLLDQFILYVLAYENSLPAARKAYKAFTDPKNFVDWNEVRVATLREVEDVLTDNRVDFHTAPVLRELLGRAYDAYNVVDIEGLREEKVDRIKQFANDVVRGQWPWAATFLLAAVNNDGQVPFDPHTERVASRLKLFDVHDNLTKKKKVLKAYGQSLDPLRLHVLFVEHGKKLCLEDSPRCDKCPLTRDCDYYARSKKKGGAKKKAAAKTAKKAAGKKKAAAKAKPAKKTAGRAKAAAKRPRKHR